MREIPRAERHEQGKSRVLELENAGVSSGLGFVRVCIVVFFFTIILFWLNQAGKEGGGTWASCEVPRCPRIIVVFFFNFFYFFFFFFFFFFFIYLRDY
jgi:hypothetical protein